MNSCPVFCLQYNNVTFGILSLVLPNLAAINEIYFKMHWSSPEACVFGDRWMEKSMFGSRLCHSRVDWFSRTTENVYQKCSLCKLWNDGCYCYFCLHFTCMYVYFRILICIILLCRIVKVGQVTHYCSRKPLYFIFVFPHIICRNHGWSSSKGFGSRSSTAEDLFLTASFCSSKFHTTNAHHYCIPATTILESSLLNLSSIYVWLHQSSLSMRFPMNFFCHAAESLVIFQRVVYTITTLEWLWFWIHLQT